jgi:hypothetical protein
MADQAEFIEKGGQEWWLTSVIPDMQRGRDQEGVTIETPISTNNLHMMVYNCNPSYKEV